MIDLSSSPHDFDRFLSKIDKRSNDDCWNWIGNFDDTRLRGRFGANKKHYDPIYIMLIIIDGVDIPSGMKVYNICGNRYCVNPEHYEIGIQFGRKVNNQIRKKQPIDDRFWSHVDIGSIEDCWEWMTSLDSKGYGQFNINQKQYRSHRISWELNNGKIPEGMCICHRCDNKKCVNPYHLFLGTQKDNMQDMARKGLHWKHRNG
jgi:hypothetical protein